MSAPRNGRDNTGDRRVGLWILIMNGMRRITAFA